MKSEHYYYSVVVTLTDGETVSHPYVDWFDAAGEDGLYLYGEGDVLLAHYPAGSVQTSSTISHNRPGQAT